MMASTEDICCMHCSIDTVDRDDLQLVGQHRKDAIDSLESKATALNMHTLLAKIKEHKNL